MRACDIGFYGDSRAVVLETGITYNHQGEDLILWADPHHVVFGLNRNNKVKFFGRILNNNIAVVAQSHAIMFEENERLANAEQRAAMVAAINSVRGIFVKEFSTLLSSHSTILTQNFAQLP